MDFSHLYKPLSSDGWWILHIGGEKSNGMLNFDIHHSQGETAKFVPFFNVQVARSPVKGGKKRCLLRTQTTFYQIDE
jgi:hypothetical protein